MYLPPVNHDAGGIFFVFGGEEAVFPSVLFFVVSFFPLMCFLLGCGFFLGLFLSSRRLFRRMRFPLATFSLFVGILN